MTLMESMGGSAETVAPGTLLADRYEIRERLGNGAMGTVYAALDQQLGEEIAVKILHPALTDDPEHQQRLRAEVRLARRVSHPNVCRVHDLGREDRRLFVTMELLDGAPLRDTITPPGEPPLLPLSRRIDILVQLAAGLSAAHRAGVIHRDIKPDNVILADEGAAGERAVLTDFGVASLARDTARHVAGTPAYMAPELLLGRLADRRCDIYSFAVLAYELIAGALPFPVSSVSDAMRRAADAAPPLPLPAGCAGDELRGALDEIFATALAADPERRPAPIEKLAELLARAAAGDRPELAAEAPRDAPERAVTALVARLPKPCADPEALERAITDLGGVPTAVSERGVEGLFGAPRSRGDDAVRAARAALALGAAHPSAAVAIHTGRARIDGEADGWLRVTGEALPRARALARSPGVFCSGEARSQLAGRFELADEGDGFRVFDRPGRSAPTHAPLVGRDAELAALEEAARVAFQERRARFVRLTGPAGIGKTRIVEELLEALSERRELDVISLRAAPFADAGPLALLRQAIPDAEHPDQLRARLLARAARHPLVLVADDLQWADGASLAFLADLERSLVDAPVLAIYAARESPPALSAAAAGAAIALGPLGDDEAQSLVLAIAPAAGKDEIASAARRAAGNPLLVVELGRALRESRPALPTSAVAAAQEQLDQLTDLCREMVYRAAVLGTSLDAAAMEALSPSHTARALESGLEHLTERGILVAEAAAGATRYRFASPLVQEVAYAQLSADERRRAHAAAAGYLASREGTDPAAVRALAEHWERAGEMQRARATYRRAGERALDHFAYREAAAALLRAEELTPENERDIDLLIQVGLALEPGDGAAAEARFQTAATRLAPGDRRRARLCLYLGRRAAARSANDEALELFRRGLEHVADDDLTTLAELNASLGGTLGYVMNDNQTGLELSERAVAVLEGTEHRRELARALSRLGGNYMRAGRWRDQLECNRRNLEIAEELGDLSAQVTAHINLGEVHKTLGETDLALEHTRAGLALCARIGSSSARAVGLSNLGILLIERGELSAGEQRIRDGIALGRRVASERFFYESYAQLARAAVLRGALEEAESAARRAVELGIASGSQIAEGIALRFLAAARGRAGETAAALSHVARAHRCLAGRDPFEDARTQVVEARLLAARGASGDEARAAALIEAARDTFEKLGAALDAAHLEDPSDLR